MKSETGARAVNHIVNDMMRSAIAAVESESTICKVILDANEDGCCIHYERGPRDYSFYDFSKAKDYHWETVKEANVSSLVNKLYRYYRIPDASLIARPQVKTFLDCALTYLFAHCRPSERTFESLENWPDLPTDSTQFSLRYHNGGCSGGQGCYRQADSKIQQCLYIADVAESGGGTAKHHDGH